MEEIVERIEADEDKILKVLQWLLDNDKIIKIDEMKYGWAL